MGTFEMDSSAVIQSGNKYQDFANEYAQQMAKLGQTIEELGSMWKGNEYNQFYADYQECAKEISQMKEAFNSLGEVLINAGNSTNDASSEISAAINRMN